MPGFLVTHLHQSRQRAAVSAQRATSLELRCRSAQPPGPPVPDHRQAGARAKRPVPAPRLRWVWGRGARPPAGPSAAHATPMSSLGAPPSWSCKEGACSSSSRRNPLRLVAVALEEDAALATHPAAPVPPWGRQAPAGAPPCAPRHLRRAPGSEVCSRRSPLRRAGSWLPRVCTEFGARPKSGTPTVVR